MKLLISTLAVISLSLNAFWCAQKLLDREEAKLAQAIQEGEQRGAQKSTQMMLESIKAAAEKDGKVTFNFQGVNGKTEPLVLEKKK